MRGAASISEPLSEVQRGRSVVVVRVSGGLLDLGPWYGVPPAEPALQVDVGATARAEGPEFGLGGFAADRALQQAHAIPTSSRSRGNAASGVITNRAPI